MPKNPLKSDCFFCEEPIQMGAGVFQGRQIPAWGILICNRCRAANSDGFPVGKYPKLEQHLAAHGVEYKPVRGKIPWP